MQFKPNTSTSTDIEIAQNPPGMVAKKKFSFPKWLGIAIFVIYGGYAGIKQFIADSPRNKPTTNQSAQNDGSVKGYATQLADKNRVTIISGPHYDLEHPMKLAFYSTSDRSIIMCSLKHVECFFNPKKPTSPTAKE
jgi:hypothetical protein